jgi:hypothetical protein
MSWKKLLAFASESLNDHLRLRHDYLLAENRILCNQIAGRAHSYSDPDYAGMSPYMS